MRRVTPIVACLDRVNRHHARVVERRHGPCLALEARQPIGVSRDLGRQDLDRHLSAELGVLRAIDLSQAPRMC